jgi:4'-phosphopantetheinyl transferase EntD
MPFTYSGSDQPLRSAVRSLFGPEVVVESAAPEIVTGQLPPQEQAFIARSVAARQAQFGTARVCARRALATLGIAPCALLPNSDRSPWWRAGVIGSIAHTEHCFAVALAMAHQVVALGLDLEADAGFKPELEEMVCVCAEREWLRHSHRSDSSWLALLLFSAKEAFYKCQYTVTRTMLDFRDVELQVDLSAGRFKVAQL